MDAKSNPHCFVCSSRVGVSNRNAVDIFHPQNKLPTSDKTLASCISEFTGKKIERQHVHSLIVCKRCFKLLQEYDELKSRVDEIKNEMISQFKNTLQKNNLNFDTYPDAKQPITSGEPAGPAKSNIVIKKKSSTEESLLKCKNIVIPDIQKISPTPTNLVIVGHKGKKITIQKPSTTPKIMSPEKFVSLEDETKKFFQQGNSKKLQIEKNLDLDSKNNIAKCEVDENFYLSEVDGMIIKTEKTEHKNDDEFVFRELEIVDDGVSNVPLEEGSIFMEQAEDGSIIRVVAGSSILQDEHGNFIYSTTDDDGIEMILPDQVEDDVHVEYKEINLKDGSGGLVKINPLKKDIDNIESDDEEKRNMMDKLDMDGEGLSNVDSLENQIVALKDSDNLYTCLICEGDESADKKVTKKTDGDDNDESENGNATGSIFIGDAALMMEHMNVVHQTDIFICDFCGELFFSRDVLQDHIEEHLKLVPGEFKCDICSNNFENETQLKRHLKSEHLRVMAYPCTICRKKFSSKAMLDHHSLIHKGVIHKGKPYSCPICSKTYASKYTQQAHIKTHTDRPRPFTCTQCGKCFFTLPNLTQHEKTHLGIKAFICKVCGKGFGTQHNLEVHGVVHTGYKPFKCKTCGKSFARRAEIRDHERTHTGERPYFCEICGAKFSQRSNLQSHKRATHFNDKRYKCCLCDKCFKRRRLLEYHIKATHTGERPFRCPICDATFVYPEHFKKHQKIHTGEKPYRCEVCNKAFNSRDNRNAHRYVHSDKKPYECLDCGAGFMRKPLLYAHMHSQGHLSDTIVVNQPRLGSELENDEMKTFVIDSIKEQSPNRFKGKDGPNLKFSKNIPILTTTSQTQDDSGMISKSESILPDNIYLEDAENTIDGDMLDSQRIEIIDGEHEVIESEDGSIRIVQLKLADGENAWVALNE